VGPTTGKIVFSLQRGRGFTPFWDLAVMVPPRHGMLLFKLVMIPGIYTGGDYHNSTAIMCCSSASVLSRSVSAAGPKLTNTPLSSPVFLAKVCVKVCLHPPGTTGCHAFFGVIPQETCSRSSGGGTVVIYCCVWRFERGLV
jgi:hypothetical protein